MTLVTYCLLLYLTNLSLCKECVINNNQLETSWESKLLNNLINKRTFYGPPIKNCTDVIDVSVRFILKYFSFDSNEENFSIYSWVFITWYDHRLTWNPNDYGAIDSIEISSGYIWTPNLKLFNSADEYEMPYFYALCQIKSNGFVKCIPRLKHEVPCISRLEHWPYDTQRCTLHFGEWNDHIAKVKYSFNGTRGVSMVVAAYGSQWTIVDFEQREDPKNKTQLSFTFELEREGKGLGAIVIVPSIVVCVLTLSNLLLDVQNNTRIGLICFSIMIHYYLLSQINFVMPHQGSDIPLVLLYARGSLIITVIVLILTYVLSYLRRKVLPPPKWVSSTNDFVFKGFMKFVIYPRWVAEGTESDDLNGKKAKEDWTDFANILNSMCLLIFIIVYSSILPAYMPRTLPALFQPF